MIVGQGTMTRFIRHEWVSRKGKVREADLYRKLKDAVQSPTEVMDYVRGLRQSADVYAAFGNPDSPVWTGLAAEGRELLRQISTFKIVQCYPLLLSGWLTRRPREFEKLARWIVALTVRYNIIGGKGTGNLETAYAQASPICRDSKEPLLKIKQILMGLYPPNNEFELTFASKRMSEEPMARLLLAELETAFSGDSEKPADPNKLTLEHILPRVPGAEWSKTLRLPPKHDELLHRIGNLTLLTGLVNSSTPNDFPSKKMIYTGSSLEITRMIAKADDWDEEAINDRQKQLAKQAVKTWRIA